MDAKSNFMCDFRLTSHSITYRRTTIFISLYGHSYARYTYYKWTLNLISFVISDLASHTIKYRRKAIYICPFMGIVMQDIL